MGQVQKYDGYNGIPEEKIERDRRNVWSHNDWEFSPINVRHQSTDPGSSENTEQNKSPPHIIFKLQKAKDKEKILKETRQGKNTVPVEEQRKIKLDIATEYK